MQLNRKALISFIIFIVVVIKDVLVGYLEIIPQRSPANRLISWFFIIPIIIIAAVLSLQVIRESYVINRNEGKPLFSINFILSLPALLWFVYVFGMIAYALIL